MNKSQYLATIDLEPMRKMFREVAFHTITEQAVASALRGYAYGTQNPDDDDLPEPDDDEEESLPIMEMN